MTRATAPIFSASCGSFRITQGARIAAGAASFVKSFMASQ
jgi:hypothetical protein